MEIKLIDDDFIYVYDLRLHGFLKRKGIKEIVVARDKKGKVFSLYYFDDELKDAKAEFDEIEQDRLARIKRYEEINERERASNN